MKKLPKGMRIGRRVDPRDINWNETPRGVKSNEPPVTEESTSKGTLGDLIKERRKEFEKAWKKAGE